MLGRGSKGGSVLLPPFSHTFLGTPARPFLLLLLGPATIHGNSLVDLG